MGSPWLDESAILRDLSFAQGRWVPGVIDSAVGGTKPPAHNITEDTEEEYYQRWTMESGGIGDFSAGPDLFQIKTMLELIQDDTPDEETLSGPIEIKKLNPEIPHFVPKKNIIKQNIPSTKKPRRARNVAIASIMALALPQEPLKLVKPEDFIKPSMEDAQMEERRKDSVNKVTNWLQSQDINTMFKKKSSANSFKDEQRNSMKDAKHSPLHSEDSVKSPNGQYTPSSWAEEYYKKAVDRSNVRSILQEDVWDRAERAMKDIDAKKEELRKLEAAAELTAEIAKQCEALEGIKLAGRQDSAAAEDGSSDDQNDTGDAETAKLRQASNMKSPGLSDIDETETTITSSYPTNEDDAEGIAKVLLQRSRHELYPGTCVVCSVLAPEQDKLPLSDSAEAKDELPSESDSSI